MTTQSKPTKAIQKTKAKAAAKPRTTKLARVIALLQRPKGATLIELCEATDWQPHSVRGALAGTVKKKGYGVLSEKTGGTRRYRIGAGS